MNPGFRRPQRPSELLELVRERISILLREAKNASSERPPHPERAKRYVTLALQLARRYTVRFPSSQKKLFCKHCRAFWIPGKNVKVRLLPKTKTLAYFCICGKASRFPYGKKKATA